MKKRPQYALAILAMAASGYALDRWLLSGVIASKWIGLPEYSTAMNELLHKSRSWGIAALVLEGLALALALLPWPEQRPDLARDLVSSLVIERNAAKEYLQRRFLRSGLCVLLTIGFAILVPLAANFIRVVIR
jgi:hypothetical protein